jgi:hypothetical protein
VYSQVQSSVYNACTGNIKGIVSRDFKGLQMVSMDRAQVPNSPAACLFFI